MAARVIGIMLVCVTGLSYLGYRQLRNITTPATSAPEARTGAIAYNDREQRALDLLAALGNTQPTADTLAFVVEWSLAEDSGSGALDRNNPWNTTQAGFNETHSINGDGVKGYATWQDGLAATVHTLTNGYYDEVVIGLQSNDPQRAKAGLIASPWAASHYNGGVGWPVYQPEQPTSGQRKCLPTLTGAVTARFTDTNSQWWAGQYLGMHNGTDYAGQPGDPVFAPFDLTVEDIQYYSDPGRMGWFIQGRFIDGYLFYSGHLDQVYVSVGQSVPACTQIGTIGGLLHTHIKIASPDKPVPCEATGCDDFEFYYQDH